MNQLEKRSPLGWSYLFLLGYGRLFMHGLERIVSLALVSSLLLPSILLTFEPREVTAAPVTQQKVPVSAPPEPFIAYVAPSKLTGIVDAVQSLVSNASALLKAREVPAGLEAARIPTYSERLADTFSPALAYFAPSTFAPKSPPTPSQPASVVDFDFDNDGKADIGRYHSANAELKVKNSNGGSESIFTVGCAPPTSSCAPVVSPGDFNGDGKTDAAVFNGGSWKYKTSTSGSEQTISWGTSGDMPVAGDYDGDGTTDAAVFRPSTNTWWISKSTGGYTSTSFGATSDVPVPGDYDGDGKNDLAIYRPSTGDWHVTGSTAGYYYSHWGIATDTPVPADYDNDGKTDFAVFRPSTGTWYVLRSSDSGYSSQTWGNWADQPVPADYDGDGKADLAVWRPTTGVWYTLKSSDSSYSIQTLGVPGDTAVPSAYLKQVGGQVSGDALAAARLSPKNATGGTNLYSQNFSWGTSLVSLPGRAGLDAGFGIGYNSLVWTKVGSNIIFDADRSNASPGFRFGFPTIEPIYYDTDGSKNVWAYMMITPSGSRIQFRQTVVSNTYETADSSYSQLVTSNATNPNDPVENVAINVRTTDGTQMSYVWSQGAYRCTEIKDRNGNYISNAYDSEGRLSTMTDTLGRVVTVNYESTTGLPSTITQTWKNSNGSGSNITHTWATFTYTTKTVATSFGSLNVVGPPNDTAVTVLQKITYPDSSYTKFTYNGYIQVEKVEKYSYGDHFLNHVRTNLSAVSGTQSDCPRFTHTYTKIDNFNMSGGAAQEVDVENLPPAASSFSGPNGTETTSVVKVTMASHPDSLYTRLHFAPSGYKEGLVLATEDCTGTDSSCGTRKRWSWSDWTQDSTSASYTTNPRVKETRVGDTSNIKVTKIDYRIVSGTTNTAEYGLVSELRVYDDNDLNNPVKKVATDYDLASAYTSRRILGLPSKIEVWGKNDVTSSLEYVSKVTYVYDDENFLYESNQIVTAARHDATNYGSTFVVGRGNLTKTTRHDVTATLSASESRTRYDVAGSPVARLDPRSRKATISYADHFNTTVSPATFAYPTTITDPGGYYSTIEYRYDIGASVAANSPTPQGAGDGKNTSRIYDDVIGRLVKDKIDNTGAYTRYDYPNNDGVTLRVYTTVVDTTGPGTIDSSDEVLTESLLDGAGRVRMTKTENPNSTGGWTGKLIEYDLLGRVKRETVPTEIDSSWNPDGDDDRGLDTNNNPIWLWKAQEYDWKDRVTREVNTDATDRLYSYDGCGCAGGQVTTVKGEITDAIDVAGNAQNTKRRTQKIYEDLLGRVKKSEIWDLDGGGSAPYATTTNSYNGRDQVVLVRQYSGSDSSSTYQDTTFDFDGHGRLEESHRPEQFDSSNNPTHTTYTYNLDDTVATMTDPRGAVATYKYGYIDEGTVDSFNEYRRVLTKIEYTSPNTTYIPDPADVKFSYDAAGNRKQMTDGSGTLEYTYDALSRLISETKVFDSSVLASPRTGGYTLQYTYHLMGGIQSITDPHSTEGWHVEYSSDKIGRQTAIGNATGFGSQTSFTNSTLYRAFAGVKSISYSTTSQTNVSLTYNDRLRPATYEAESSANTVDIQNKTFTYSSDGSIKQSTNAVDYAYSQKYEYDFASRLKKNDVAVPPSGPSGTRYNQTLGYDAFSNITSRQTWDEGSYRGFTAGYTNNRRTSGGFDSGTNYYDLAGNVVGNSRAYLDGTHWKFDAAGRVADWDQTSIYLGSTRWDQGEAITFDGDGRTAKRLKRSRVYASPPSGWYYTPAYYINSSVTGQTLIECDDSGARKKVNIYMGSTIIAEHTVGGVAFKHTDPVTGSVIQTTPSGAIEPGDVGRVEREPLGAVLPTQEPELQDPQPHDFGEGGSTHNPEDGCTDGFSQTPMPCNVAAVYQNYLSNLEFTLDEIRKQKNTRAPRKPEVIRAGEAAPRPTTTRYEGWKFQTFPTDWIFADNQSNDHPGLTFSFLGLVDDREQWGWTANLEGGPDIVHEQLPLGREPSPPPDPCAGRKGALDFSKRMNNHIFPRHISERQYPDKSKYTFWPSQTTRADYEAEVRSLGQTTFENGVFIQWGNRVVYTYAFPGVDAGDDGWIFREVGIDGESGDFTNVNTVIVDARDCKSVFSAYPGLPFQFKTVPGAIFKPDTWLTFSTQHGSGL